MYRDKKVVVVMPAYNAAQTIRRTYQEVMEQEIVDLVIIVDDHSTDDTVSIARTLDNPFFFAAICMATGVVLAFIIQARKQA